MYTFGVNDERANHNAADILFIFFFFFFFFHFLFATAGRQAIHMKYQLIFYKKFIYK